jgi:hypothetical protein
LTSSGTYTYSLANAEAVLAAFERIQMDATELKQKHFLAARREINLLLSDWANKQVNLWKVTLNSFPLVSGTATYTLPSNVVMVLDAYFSSNEGTVTQTDIYMTPISRDAYASYPQKQTPANIVTMYWFNRQIVPTFTTFPVINVNGNFVNYYCVTQMQDANLANGETPDIPYMWYDAFVADLSWRMAMSFKPEMEDKRKMGRDEAWKVAASQGTENVNLTISPDVGAYYR